MSMNPLVFPVTVSPDLTSPIRRIKIKRIKKYLEALFLLVVISAIVGHNDMARTLSDETAFAEQNKTSIHFLLQTLFASQIQPGVVIASPSRAEPDYFYHWVRDAAIVFEQALVIY